MKYLLITLLFILSACQAANQPTSGDGQEIGGSSPPASDDPLDIQGLEESMVSAGATVGQEGEVEQPFFSVPGQVMTINGESVQVFEYADASQADAEAGQVSPDGSSIGTSMATWIGPPHFYRTERLIVLYVGNDQSVIELLETVLGPQFAGAEPPQESVVSSEPPAAILFIGEAEQVSVISNYCWTVPGEEHGICADGIGYGTQPDPLEVESPFVASFTTPLSGSLDSLTLSVRPLTQEDKLPEELGGMHWWRPKTEDQILKQLTPPYEVELSLKPGLYLFNYFAAWEEYGEAAYSFLVEVKA